MSSNWAYFNRGNNHHQTMGGATARPASLPRGRKDFFDIARDVIGGSGVHYDFEGNPTLRENPPGKHFIGFDGERWRVAYGALPRDFLDPVKYPEHLYSYEGIGGYKAHAPGLAKYSRECHWLHGYASADATFPQHIPQLDKAQIAALHEQHVIPNWFTKQEYLKEQGIMDPNYVRPQKTETSYVAHTEIPHVTMESALPESTIQKLKEAHVAGKPVLFAYDANTKTVEDLSARYQSTIKAERLAQASQPKPSRPSSSPSSAASAAESSASSSTAKEAGFWEKALDFKNTEGKMRWGKVTGIVAGTAVAAGAVYALWPKKQSESWVKHTKDASSHEASRTL